MAQLTHIFKSIRIWVSINVPIISYGIITQKVISEYVPNMMKIPIYFVAELIKNVTLINVMNNNKPQITERISPSITSLKIMLNLVAVSLIKGVAQYWISSTFLKSYKYSLFTHIPNIPTQYVLWFMLFMCRSFIFEVVFDFFHYWAHRSAHAIPNLYRLIHKQHHQYHEPTATTAFYMSPLDLILTHCVPLLLTVLTTAQISYFTRIRDMDFMIINGYLSYQEVGGHLGRWMSPTSSFAQCIWIPKWLDIELYTEDHDLHHSQIKYNYSKRFAIWDKLFGTYKKSVHPHLSPHNQD